MDASIRTFHIFLRQTRWHMIVIMIFCTSVCLRCIVAIPMLIWKVTCARIEYVHIYGFPDASVPRDIDMVFNISLLIPLDKRKSQVEKIFVGKQSYEKHSLIHYMTFFNSSVILMRSLLRVLNNNCWALQMQNTFNN